MRKRLVAGNWKMNLTVEEAATLVKHLDKSISASTKTEVVLCPPNIALTTLAKTVPAAKFKLGAQNIYYQDFGAFTGEVSAAQVKDLVDYVLVGHSERRLIFSETNDVVARKVSAVVRNGLTPILCVGENLFERQDSETVQVIHDQLASGLIMLTTREVAQVVVAYEPVWAIGTGEIAKPEQIKQAVAGIRKTITELYGATVAEMVRVLYGGSVTADFAPDYMKINGLDGFLVGGASLNAPDFAAIVKATQASLAHKAKAGKV